MKNDKNSKECKCDNCINGFHVMSENGWHTNCTLSKQKFIQCYFMKKNYYIGKINKKI